MVADHEGDPRALGAAILGQWFSGHAKGEEGEAADDNRGKLANNCKLGLIAYGIIERRDATLTEFGRELHGLRDDEPALYRALARRILLNLNGLNLVQCV